MLRRVNYTRRSGRPRVAQSFTECIGTRLPARKIARTRTLSIDDVRSSLRSQLSCFGAPARVPVQAGASLAGKLSSEASSTLSSGSAASGDGPGAAARRLPFRTSACDAASRSGVRSALSRITSSSAADLHSSCSQNHHYCIIAVSSTRCRGRERRLYAAQLGEDTTFHREAAGGTRCS